VSACLSTMPGTSLRKHNFGGFGVPLLWASSVLLVTTWGGQARAEVDPAESAFNVSGRSRTLPLDECIQLARANFPKVRAARARLDKREREKFEARTAPFSEFQLSAGAGVVPTWRGTAVYSPSTDASLTSDMSVAFHVGVEGVIPIWTFGKLRSAWAATDAAADAGRSEVLKEQNDVELEVRRAYYGVVLARAAKRILDEALVEINRGVAKIEDKLKQGQGDESAFYRLKMYVAEIEARGSDADKGETTALIGLRFLTGSSVPLDVRDAPLRRAPHELLPVTVYLEAARLYRPELNMVRSGIQARKALVRLERARYFPDFGVHVVARLTRAPDATDQRNPYSYDPLNFPVLGAALALRWKLDFLPQGARVAKAQADLEEMRATESFAMGGVASEVQEAYEAAQDAKRRLDAWHKAADYAKRWLISVQQGADLGLVEDDEFMEPAKEYALKRFNELTAIYDYNVALARLGQTTGSGELLAQMDPGSGPVLPTSK
jgi:outer membrane protein TolC